MPLSIAWTVFNVLLLCFVSLFFFSSLPPLLLLSFPLSTFFLPSRYFLFLSFETFRRIRDLNDNALQSLVYSDFLCLLIVSIVCLFLIHVTKDSLIVAIVRTGRT